MIKNLIKWQTLSSVVTFSLSLIQVAILSRLLELSDFGLVAIVMLVVNITQVLSDLGMANYLVYRQKISEILNSTVFWICSLSGLVLAISIILISPLVASAYEEPEIKRLLSIAALSFIPISLSSQIQARYVCNFKLDLVAKFEVISKLAGTIIAVIIALKGYGAVSIIIGSLVSSMTKCALLWLKAERSWLPCFKFSLIEAKNAWNYGMYQIGSQLISQFRGNLDTLILGFYINSVQLGAYSLAKQLIQKPAAFILPIVHKISLPLLAASQSKKDELKALFGKAHAYVAFFLVLPYSLLCVMSENIVLIMYGMNNIQVATYIAPLSIFWACRSIGGALAGSLTQGLGKTKIDFYWNLFVLIVFTAVCLLTASHGALYVSWGLAILQLALLNLVYFVFYKRIISFEFSGFIKPILASTGLSVASIGIGYYCLEYLFPSNMSITFTFISILASIIIYYIGGCYLQSDIIKFPRKRFKQSK
ncbi:lipopolysaccharide biosynthesis protein [Vibrio cincinnatiensis]|uniref:lipopolysaccharide biosynthesis protein n=1 Tax=Vibrio cincinnatiensis TaxID=675 RepID=UPI001EDFA8D1|nr:lipopolysaccharide biosynthesis protein [Vibrio cincinnatiensis]MCG3744036.1 lipopolysaccharide biosynthesis protein [Vibrio cincinnatiensis]